jgi:predicted GIY-YIG superfamily endonuclease
MTISIYVLECEDGKYYVGKTNRLLEERITEHFEQEGSEWTKLYKPVRVKEAIVNADNYDEDKYTIKYMKEYGIWNVRGGTFSKPYLPYHQLQTLKEAICNASNMCFRCYRIGHFMTKCYATSYPDGSVIPGCEENKKENSQPCYRCKRNGHKAFECYAVKDRFGNVL